MNIAPRFDDATEYSFSWNKHLMETDISEDILFSFLEAEATPQNFQENLSKVDTIIFYDHGAEDSLIGQDGLKLITVEEAHLLKNKQIYTMACSSAKVLGIEAYKKGCKEYWGAIEPIGFVPDDAEMFEAVYNLGAYQRFKEKKSIKEVLHNMEEKFNEQIDVAENGWTRIWLRVDRDIWRCWSNKTPPTGDNTECFWRKFAVKIFGRRGWKIPNLQCIWSGFTKLFF